MESAPTTPVFTVEAIARAVEGALIVCFGGFGSPADGPHDRVGVFDWSTGTLLLDGWIPSPDGDRLIATLGAGRGGWDTMYATGFSVAWGARDGVFRVWTSAGATVEWGADPSILAVESFLGADWVKRGVRVRRAEGIEVVAEVEETIASWGGPFYDGLDLLADTGWAHGLGRSLALHLGVPYVDGLE